jgi:hypothetical protein
VAAEIFLVGAVLVVAVLLGRWLSIRLEVPEAAAYVVLGGLVGCCPGWRRSSSPGRRAAAVPAPADLLRRLLQRPTGDGRAPPGGDRPVGRIGAGHRGNLCRRAAARLPRRGLGGGARVRRRGRPAGPGGRDERPAATRRAAPVGDRAGGRGPDQRRDRADRVRAGGDGRRGLAHRRRRRAGAARADRWRHRHRARGRRREHLAAAPGHRQRQPRGAVAGHPLPGLRAGATGARVRGAGHRHRGGVAGHPGPRGWSRPPPGCRPRRSGGP